MQNRLIHVCSDVLPEVWRQLGSNAKLSGVSLRDFLTYLIIQSEPVGPEHTANTDQLQQIVRLNRKASHATRREKARLNLARKSSSDSSEENEEIESVGNRCEVLGDERTTPALGELEPLNMIQHVPSTTPRRLLTAVELLQQLMHQSERINPDVSQCPNKID